ncbi:arf-GAP with SH3 ANK repeat and PH domain-containing 2 [Chlorella sorokiniana]|uniref:Arf-GAP with SH3 ANK repeat and PH domain-containing 2 n=1 Tax=Chlorella sorokiniana TaxID=3076 RepID=A0A2P6TSU9_CHLSO|nr:arf-GAP with SH3 ANK repeat and PH domain-containing 2 [Chlorella sorokiniana]|eukprot:PRW57148.1 arf-GAP with SH3 ANK repeat and PH domain-containing 2 [Chlorella sorokiniana]
MALAMLCSPAAHCKPAAAFGQAARRQAAGLPALSMQRRQFAVRAGQQPTSSGSTGGSEAPPAAEAGTPTPPTPPLRSEVAPWDRAPRQIDMASQPDALGPVGNALMAVLLIVLCGACVFFTVGRQFQPDLVPLTPEQLAMMQQ